MPNEQNEIELQSEYIVLMIPQSTVEVTVSAKVWNGRKVIDVERTMLFGEVRNAIKDAQENYIPEDAVFMLTDFGKKQQDLLKAGHLARFEENE